MELKKTPKADLQNKRGLFLEIGLVISLIVVVGAFMYTPKEHRIEQVDLEHVQVDEQVAEITRQEEEPPPPPPKIEVKVIADLLDVVDNDTNVDMNIDFVDFDEDVQIEQIVAVVEEEIDENEIFVTVEQMPMFQGGDLRKFHAWVQKNVRFPQIALENGIQGRVSLKFVIEPDGRLTQIQVLQTPDRSLSEEAVRVLKKSPLWTPGKQRNKAVRVYYTLPVEFRLQQ